MYFVVLCYDSLKCSCLHFELHAAAGVIICLQYCKCLVQQRCGLRFSFYMERMSLDTNHLLTVIYDLIGKQAKPVRHYQGCTNSTWCGIYIYICMEVRMP